MASYTALPDLTTGDLVPEAWIDGIRNNADYLLNPNTQTVHNTTWSTTTSSTYEDIAGASAVVTGHGGPMLATFHAHYISGYASVQFDLVVDGVSETNSSGVIMVPVGQGVAFTRIVTGLASGVHVLKAQWKKYQSQATGQMTGLHYFGAIEL